MLLGVPGASPAPEATPERGVPSTASLAALALLDPDCGQRYLALGGCRPRRRLRRSLPWFFAFFRSALGSCTRLLEGLRGYVMGQGWLMVLSLRLLEGTLTLYNLRLLHLRLLLLADVLMFVPWLLLSLQTLLLEAPLALVFLLLESPLTLVFLPLLELLSGSLLLTFLLVTGGFVLQSTPFSPTLYP